MESPDHNKQTLFQYYPLVVILVMSFLLALIFDGGSDAIMYRFMGFFLVIFSLFKWVDYKGFVRAFSEYDLVSRIFAPYRFIYPVVELALGLGYVALFMTPVLNIVTIVVMFLNALSVAKVLAAKRKIHCACLGTVIQLPLTIVSLFESVGMIVMAMIMML